MQLKKYFDISQKDVIQSEMDIFAKLEFGLFVDPAEVVPHLVRINTMIEIRSKAD